jgi:hypothetical protein
MVYSYQMFKKHKTFWVWSHFEVTEQYTVSEQSTVLQTLFILKAFKSDISMSTECHD